MGDGQEQTVLSCGECGQDKIITQDDIADDVHITCDACGADYGTWGALKYRLNQLGVKIAKDVFGETFKGFKNIKFEK